MRKLPKDYFKTRRHVCKGINLKIQAKSPALQTLVFLKEIDESVKKVN